jgi:DNA-binding LacI/PurR family transcriptional regulator
MTKQHDKKELQRAKRRVGRPKADVTIEDIAREAKVSPTTVSRVFNGDHLVAGDTAKIVRQHATRLGYKGTPKAAKKRAQNGEPARIFITAGDGDSTPSDEIYLACALHLAEAGYKPVYLPSSQLTPKNLQQGAGLLVRATKSPVKTNQLSQTTPCVQLFGEADNPNRRYDVVTYDNWAVGTLAAEWLQKEGHQKLTIVTPTNPAAERRAEAFKARARALGCTVSHIKIRNNHAIELNAGREIAEVILKQKDPVDALFGFNDHTIVALYPWLSDYFKQHKTRIIGCDALPQLAQLPDLNVASIDIHLPQIVSRAVETLIWRINHSSEQPNTITVIPEVIPRREFSKRSTAPSVVEITQD